MDPFALFLNALITGTQAKPPVVPPTPVAQEQLVAFGDMGGMGGTQPPRISAATRGTPYGQLGCMSRAQNALYSSGATSVNASDNAVRGAYGSSSALAWCRGDMVIIVGAGPQADAVIQAITAGF